MPKIGESVSYFNSNGDEKAAIVTAVHADGAVDLCVLSANTRRVETRVWKEPGTCQVLPELSDEPAPMPEKVQAASLPAELQRPTLTSIAQEATDVPVPGETTSTEDPDGRAQE